MPETIKILLVDDIAEVRENVKKLLSFESDFEVIGSAANGRDGIRMAKELRPDVIIMDINMPDIDGISATQEIVADLPAVGVIMMSVNSDRDYMRRAMTAGASDFLTKPANMDDLYNTIRSVYKVKAGIREQVRRMNDPAFQIKPTQEKTGSGERAGHVIVCYSPKGGAGTTAIAVNIASALMSEETRVLLIDSDVQFGDIGVFLNLQSQSSVADLVADIGDIDVELFDNIVVTHGSGLKALLAPTRPEQADPVNERPGAIAEIIKEIRYNYDFIIVDTATRLDETTLALCDLATYIMLISTPTLPSVRSTRYVLDLFDQIYDENFQKVKLVLTQVHDEKRGPRVTIPAEKITSYLKRDVYGSIPHADKVVLQSIIKGVPVIAAEGNNDPARQMKDLANRIRAELMGGDSIPQEEEEKSSGGFRLFGR